MKTIQGELKSLQDNQRLLAILVFSLVTIVIWVGFSLISSQSKSSISAELRALAKPLNPTINTNVLTQIESMRSYSPQELQNFTIYSIKLSDQQKSIFSQQDAVTVAPTASGSANTLTALNALNNQPVASQSASPSATPVATSSAQTVTP